MSLVENIERNADKIRFHTPGHSGREENAGRWDVTELSYSDNLLCPQGEIAALEKRIAAVYGAEGCFLSTQGATTSLREAIFVAEGDFLLVGKLHSSIYHSMRLLGRKAYHIDELTEKTTIPPSVGTAILTSPDYFGNCLPLEEICRFLHERGVRVICDGAHGSHFVFSEELPPSANRFADLTVFSLHKTLPVMTGASVLLTKDKEMTERCALARKMIHGTSPSYVTLCSVERAFTAPLRYDEVLAAVRKFKGSLAEPFTVLHSDDLTRLVISSPYDGSALSEAIEERGFVAEMSADRRVVFIVTPYNYESLPALQRAIESIDRGTLPLYAPQETSCAVHAEPTFLTFGGEWERVPLEEAIGRKLYIEAGLYPPGVPLAYSHERLTTEQANLLAARPENRFGLDGDFVYVVKEVVAMEKRERS